MTTKDNYLKHIQDLTYFYVKKRYKKYCKNNNIKFIEKKDLQEKVKSIFINEKSKYEDFIFKSLENDFSVVDLDKVHTILNEMREDTEFICKRITEIIDQHQIDKGYYTSEPDQTATVPTIL